MNRFFYFLLSFIFLTQFYPTADAIAQIEPFGLQGKKIVAAALNSSSYFPGDLLLVAATDSHGVFIRNLSAPDTQWTHLGLTGKRLTAIGIQHVGYGPFEGHVLYAGVSPDYSSGDSTLMYRKLTEVVDTTWTPADSGLGFTDTALPVDDIVSLYFSGHEPPQPVFAGSGSTIYRSADGFYWQSVYQGFALNFLEIHREFLSGIIWGGGGFFDPLLVKSVDKGATWDSYFIPLPSQHNSAYSLAIDPVHPDTVYAGLWGGVAKTTDGGPTWNVPVFPPNDVTFTGLAINPAHTDHLLAGGTDQNQQFALYESSDGGGSWSDITPAQTISGITCMVADTLNQEFAAYMGTRSDGFYRYKSLISNIESDVNTGVPRLISLSQNYPNPFNAATTIEYRIPAAGAVVLKIVNLQGQTVATFQRNHRQSGTYTVQWNAAGMPSGIYLYRLEMNRRHSEVRKLILLK